MASLLRYTAIAALASSVSGFAIGAFPTQTLADGYGQVFLQPTAAPSVELVKQKLKQRALTNICTEWTIPGGFGQPQCVNSQTCLFQTVNGRLYEGCGQTSIAYDWITQCWNYPQSGVPPKSEIFCPAEEPYCGFFGFDFGSGFTAYNFGCSTSAYGLIVTRIETDGFNSSDTTTTDESFATPDPTATETSTPATPTIFVGGSDSTSTPSSSPRPTPSPNKHSKKPIGAIVGGAVGGVAVLALLAFLLWFCLRKRKQKRAESAAAQARIQNEQASALTAYGMNNNNVAEIGGAMKPATAYGASQQLQQQQQHPAMGVYPEKQTAGVGTQEVYRPALGGHLSSGGENTNTQSSVNGYPPSQSPPPVYTNPSSTLIPSPPSQYSELAQDQTQRRASNLSSQGGVSPMGSGFSPPQGQSHSPMVMQSPPPPAAAATMGTVNELGTHSEVNELGGENRGSWNVPPGVQEMGGGQSSSGGIARRPVGGGTRRSQVDMNGAPLSEEFRHELQ
ncbi:hypothetical protein ONS95_009419 [Cadophora gregata]|uniref:uncharacterized protein n=1 Tax=Cadophora gregata TaxID=51156 RepID=UPI0026DB5B5E|nr:uncharacterized protein ONS95_009419 [Cadophora gregata]KAK0124467.1 hypothetical protein ONS95_009419 [Cadophora gregata]